MNKGFLKRSNVHVQTPPALFATLDSIYHFTGDPCPLNATHDALAPDYDWPDRSYVNPPFANTKLWFKKAIEQLAKGKFMVFLVPVNSDTAYWRELVFPYVTDFILISSHVTFVGYDKPFPRELCLLVFDPQEQSLFSMVNQADWMMARLKLGKRKRDNVATV